MRKINSVLFKTVFLLLALCIVTTTAMADDDDDDFYVKPSITAEQAVSAVKDTLPKLTAGKSFVKRGEHGKKKLEVPLVLDGRIVSKIKLDPASGEVLTRGQRVPVRNVTVSQELTTKIVRQTIPKLEVASVRLGEHGEWKVDLTLNKAVVACVSVRGIDGYILPDRETTRDAAIY
ncbi:MAG: hypothetical protein A4E64_01954 [Syntrophorhabdus sp. PtaU1.Bin058]|nr:MAG: hypothetical protein A4E64_01954 [Syntrophorhabdus sp. PtaU1.Bin058]